MIHGKLLQRTEASGFTMRSAIADVAPLTRQENEVTHAVGKCVTHGWEICPSGEIEGMFTDLDVRRTSDHKEESESANFTSETGFDKSY